MPAERRRARAARPAVSAGPAIEAGVVSAIRPSRRVLMVDLNNFSTFPTYAIGLLVAAMRNGGNEVRVLSPLAHDVPASERERAETWADHLRRRIHLSTSPPLRLPRDLLRDARTRVLERPHPVVLREVEREIAERRPDAILLSAYLQHYRTVRDLAALAKAAGIPVLLGGPMFNITGVATSWRELPGLAAIVGAEADLMICDILEALCTSGDLGRFPGITLPQGPVAKSAPPLRNLDTVPFPDYSDFPWDRYRVRIVPLMAGRGCQWDKCLFCSDVVSASGRTFRTRSAENVLIEMQEQARRYGTTNFLFLDLKLNSWPDMIRSIGENIQSYVHGAEWIGTVHVDLRRDNGLSRADLRAAVAGGMRRISFGLESGSQRLLDLMQKGTSVEANSDFIRNAYEAGLSVRCTMFKGFPGETAEDMRLTAEFLEQHMQWLDRVRFNEFTLMEDTPVWHALRDHAGQTSLEILRHEPRRARAIYTDPEKGDRAYRKAKARALQAVYEINRRPVRSAARQFDGLM